MFIRNCLLSTVVLPLFFLLNAGFKLPLLAQNADTSTPYNNFGPITDYNSALKDSFNSKQIKKGERYNLNNEKAPELGESSESNLFDLPKSHTSKSSSPTDYDTIVVGTVANGQSYLSSDRRNIYSEFKVDLREVIKSPNSHALAAGQTIEIERKGGAIRLPSGKILQRGSLTESMPQVGKRYALVLQFRDDTGSFILKTGYQLEGNHVYSLDDDQSGSSALNHPLKEHGGTENQLVEELRKSASSGKEEN